MSNNEFKTLTYDFKAISADIRRRAAIVHRLNRFQLYRTCVRNVTYADIKYIRQIEFCIIYKAPCRRTIRKSAFHNCISRLRVGSIFLLVSGPMDWLFWGGEERASLSRYRSVGSGLPRQSLQNFSSRGSCLRRFPRRGGLFRSHMQRNLDK